MHAIKFKVWDAPNGEWLLPDETHTSADILRVAEAFPLDLTAVQFTGITAKNKKDEYVDLYEGDIIETFKLMDNFQGEIVWHENDCCWAIKTHFWFHKDDREYPGGVSLHNVGGCGGVRGHLKIIGNVFENKDLVPPEGAGKNL